MKNITWFIIFQRKHCLNKYLLISNFYIYKNLSDPYDQMTGMTGMTS